MLPRSPLLRAGLAVAQRRLVAHAQPRHPTRLLSLSRRGDVHPRPQPACAAAPHMGQLQHAQRRTCATDSSSSSSDAPAATSPKVAEPWTDRLPQLARAAELTEALKEPLGITSAMMAPTGGGGGGGGGGGAAPTGTRPRRRLPPRRPTLRSSSRSLMRRPRLS